MLISAMNENSMETRVAITPSTVKQYLKLGLEVCCEENAGLSAGFPNQAYKEAGASLVKDRKTLLEQTNILVTVDEPFKDEIKGLKPDSLLIGHIENNPQSALINWCLQQRISVYSMNYVPRISRAQSIDSLSSQANLAGYRAVLSAVTHYNRAVPMMMTAAGMIHPAKVLVLGAGVAGLQAIATAKRLGAVVQAFDVRAAAKEQVESLGGEFIEVGDQQTNPESASGYAIETDESYRHLQAQLIDEHAQKADIIICTALIPEKKAPLLLKKRTVENMKPGSVIVDLATARGGNCEVSELDSIIKYKEITIIGFSNMAGLVPATASELYANNLVNLIKLFANATEKITINEEDEIIRSGMICHDGQHLPFQYTEEKLS